MEGNLTTRPGPLEDIVKTCLEAASVEADLPDAVQQRMLRVLEQLATGALDATDRGEMGRRIELTLHGFDQA